MKAARARCWIPSILLAAGAVACSDGPRSPGSGRDGPLDASTGNQVGEAVRTALANAEYSGIFQEPVRLTDGEYHGPPFVPGGASRPELTLASDPVAGGDLDGDGNVEYVAVLARSDGGSGTFLYLAIMRPVEGGLASIQAILLGDRVQVTGLEVQNRAMVADVLSHAATDPACCPSLPGRRVWEWYDGQLREVVVLRGHVVQGGGGWELTPCEGGRVYRAQDGTGGDMPELFRGLSAGSDQPVFMEVRALLGQEAAVAAALESDAPHLITDVFRAAREGPGCEEDLTGVDFRAMGVEPFWALDLAGGSLELRSPGTEPRLFQVETTSESAQALRFSGRAEEGETLTVEFSYSRCIDPMSGAVFPLQAEVQVDGRTIRGCAVAGTG